MAIIKTEADKIEFVTLMADAFQAVMVPALDDIAEKIETKIEGSAAGVKNDLGTQINSLSRKFDAQQDRLDRHDKRITKLEEKARFVAS